MSSWERVVEVLEFIFTIGAVAGLAAPAIILMMLTIVKWTNPAFFGH